MKRHPRPIRHRPLEWLVSELSGQSELGAKREMRILTRAILRHPDLGVAELWEAVTSIGMMDSSRTFRKEVENTYQRMRPKERHRARSIMMDYYYMINEFDLALSFCSIRSLNSPSELMFAMDLYLHANRLDEAKAVARKCEKALPKAETASDAGSLIEAIACYHARCRNWGAALEAWSLAPRDEPMARNAAVGRAEVFIAGALDAISSELATVTRLMKQPPSELNLSLPGIEDKLYKDTQRDLLRIKRGLERLLPGRSRRAFGLIE